MRRGFHAALGLGVLLAGGCSDDGPRMTAGEATSVAASGSPTSAPTEGGGSEGSGEAGESGEAGGETGDPLACTEPAVGPALARRMTRLEYNNTVRDLLGDTTRPADGFAPEEIEFGFNNNAGALTVTELLAEQYMSAAEGLAATATQDLTKLLPCDPLQVGEQACGEAFITTFGRRAYRRPLLDDERQRLLTVFAWGLAQEGFKTGIELALTAMLQSPNFLYRVEAGVEDPGLPDGLRRVSDFELASRLSYLLWKSAPDDALLDAAAGGTLSDPAVLKAQAERLLADPRGTSGVLDFYAQLLDLEALAGAAKDPLAFAEFSDDIRAFMHEETLRFVEHVIFADDAKLQTLLTAPYTFLNAALADYYGLPGSAGAEFVRVDLPADHPRRGLLTQGSLLATLGKFDSTAPVHRGQFVRLKLLCQVILPPPDVEFMPPEIDPNATTREKYTEHSVNPACSGCHWLMDPIGFGFEHFDGAGRYRAVENGFPIDASGNVIASDKLLDGDFDGVGELAAKMAESPTVRACVVRQHFRHAFGREPAVEDACTLESLEATLAAGDLKGLVLAMTASDAFRLLATEGP